MCTHSKRMLALCASFIAAYVLATVTLAASPSSPASGTRAKTGEQIKWQVVSSGGNRGASTNFALSSSVGQTASGLAASTNYKVNQGFWQNFGSSSCCTAATTGDVDASAAVDISDLSIMVDYLFNSLPFPGSCFEEQDVDRSGSVDIADLSVLVDYLFSGGGLPACP